MDYQTPFRDEIDQTHALVESVIKLKLAPRSRDLAGYVVGGMLNTTRDLIGRAPDFDVAAVELIERTRDRAIIDRVLYCKQWGKITAAGWSREMSDLMPLLLRIVSLTRQEEAFLAEERAKRSSIEEAERASQTQPKGSHFARKLAARAA